MTGFIIDGIIPGAFRLVHFCWMIVSFVVTVGLAAMTSRSPHLLDGESLQLRTGPFGQLRVPLRQIAGLHAAHEVKNGFGLRRVRGDESSVVCSTTGSVNVVMPLKDPIEVQIGRGKRVAATRVFFNADDPRMAAAAISRAVENVS